MRALWFAVSLVVAGVGCSKPAGEKTTEVEQPAAQARKLESRTIPVSAETQPAGVSPKQETRDGPKEIAVRACLQEGERLVDEYAKARKAGKPQREPAALRKKLLAVRDGMPPMPVLLDRAEQVLPISYLDGILAGKAGVVKSSDFPGFPRLDMRVAQVVDDGEALLKFQEQFYDAQGGRHDVNKVFAVKMRTEQLADDLKVSFAQFVVVTGTRRLNGRTFFVMESVEGAWLKAEVAKRMPAGAVERIRKLLDE